METTSSETTERGSLAALLGRIAASLEHDTSTGDIAELRRLDPDHPGSPAFWRIVVASLDPSLPPDGPARSEALRRWATILRTLAQLTGLHDPRQPLGVGAIESGVSETRFLKLLRATGGTLSDSVRTIGHQLATAGVRVDVADFARLILSDGRADESAVRERIAYRFYAHLHHMEKGRA